VSEISCPRCDAPAPSRARRCASCGYSFVEAGDAPRPSVPRGLPVALAGAVTLAVAVTAAILLLGDGEGDTGGDPIGGLETRRRLEVVSDRPLGTRAAERRLEERFTAERDDDSAAVRCAGRVAKPAHSIRRCRIRYPGGMERIVVLLTDAAGNEVLSEP
jgi:hypothetical protein